MSGIHNGDTGTKRKGKRQAWDKTKANVMGKQNAISIWMNVMLQTEPDFISSIHLLTCEYQAGLFSRRLAGLCVGRKIGQATALDAPVQ